MESEQIKELNIDALTALVRLAIQDNYPAVNDAIVGFTAIKAQIDIHIRFKVDEESGMISIYVDSGVKMSGIGVPSTGWNKQGQMILFGGPTEAADSPVAEQVEDDDSQSNTKGTTDQGEAAGTA